MTVLSGSQGALLFRGAVVAKCRAWEMSYSRRVLDTTTLCVTDATGIYGRATGRGTATVLYDPDNTAAVEMFNSVFTDGQSEDGISFVLDGEGGTAYNETGYVEAVSPSVQVGNAHACRVTFRLSDTAASIVITGPDEVLFNSTRLYLSTVLGVPPQAITYLWTSMGATFDDPTKQNPLVTFDTAGTTTLKVTATLEDLSTLEATLDVTVSTNPVAFAIRPRLPFGNEANQLDVIYDEPRGLVYYIWEIDPFTGAQEYLGITKVDLQGDVLATWKLGYVNGASPNNGEGVKASGIRPSNGDLYIALGDDSSNEFLFRISSEGALIFQKTSYSGSQATRGPWLTGRIRFSPDGQYIISEGSGYEIVVMDADTCSTEVNTYDTDPAATNWSVMPDGRYLATANVGNGWGIYEFAPYMGNDPLNTLSVLSTPLYTENKPDTPIAYTPIGYTGVRAEDTALAAVLTLDAQFNVTDHFAFRRNAGVPAVYNTFWDPNSVSPFDVALGVGSTVSVDYGYETAAPGQPNPFGSRVLGLALHSNDMKNPYRYINLCASGLSQSAYSHWVGSDGRLIYARANNNDQRTPCVFMLGDINANAGTYNLPLTNDDDALDVTITMQIGDLSSYTPSVLPLTVPGKNVDDFVFTITSQAIDEPWEVTTDFSLQDASTEFTYEIARQFP